jgi:SSS family solute:Na+ symporter
MTLSEEIASYYGNNRVVVEFSNITLFLSQLCWLTVQIMGGASVIAAVTGLSPEISVVIAGLITAGIAIPGGFKSVVYTDFLQATILLSGFGVMTYAALHNAGGLFGLRQSVPHNYFSFLGVSSYGGWKIAGLIAALSLSVLADPGRRLSMYGSRSVGGARASMVIAGTTVILFSAVIGITGMYAFRLNPKLPVPDEALLWLVMNILPVWLAALVVVSVTSGIFSCANGNAMAVSSFFVRHIFPLATGRYPNRPLLAARLSLVAAFALCTFIALHAGTIVGFVIKFLPVTMSGLAIIIILGRFWKRATWQGALAAQVITPFVSLAVMFFFPKSTLNNAVLLAVPGVIALVVVSLATPPSSRTFSEVAEELTREREAIEGQSGEKLGTGGVVHGVQIEDSMSATK